MHNGDEIVFGHADIACALRSLGVNPGDGLFVHTALGRIGHVIGGPRGFIQGLVDTVGPSGLVGMPGFSDDAYDPVGALGTTPGDGLLLPKSEDDPSFHSLSASVPRPIKAAQATEDQCHPCHRWGPVP